MLRVREARMRSKRETANGWSGENAYEIMWMEDATKKVMREGTEGLLRSRVIIFRAENEGRGDAK